MSREITIERFDLRVKINVKAIKAEIKRLEQEIRAGKHANKEKQRAYSKWESAELKKPKGVYRVLHLEYIKAHGKDSAPYSPKCGLYSLIKSVTELYQIRAHSRGRLHMKGMWDSKQDNLADQAFRVESFIGELVQEGSHLITKL